MKKIYNFYSLISIYLYLIEIFNGMWQAPLVPDFNCKEFSGVSWILHAYSRDSTIGGLLWCRHWSHLHTQCVKTAGLFPLTENTVGAMDLKSGDLCLFFFWLSGCLGEVASSFSSILRLQSKNENICFLYFWNWTGFTAADKSVYVYFKVCK